MSALGLFFIFLICAAFLTTAYDTLSWVRFKKRRKPKKKPPQPLAQQGSVEDRAAK